MKKHQWTTINIPDLAGKTVIVTGANTGLGKETAKAIAKKNATVILAVRNIEKGENAAVEIKKHFPESILKVMKLDLSGLLSIRKFSDAFSESFGKLHYFITAILITVIENPAGSRTPDLDNMK